MALQTDDEKKAQMHQMPISKRNTIEIYRVLPTKHSTTAKSNAWVMIPGLQRTIRVTEDLVDVIITVHAHAMAQTTSVRVDLGIFVDGKPVGIDGHNRGDPSWSKCHGTGITHTGKDAPLISFASISLAKRDVDYVVDCRVMNQSNNGEAAMCNGPAMLIQVFKSQPIVEWIDIDLDDDQIYFNKDLEYKIQIKAKTTSYAISVSKENIWFFYGDTNPGIKCIHYKQKRAFDDQYFVTKIQCSVRKSK
eukprot:271273_1